MRLKGCSNKAATQKLAGDSESCGKEQLQSRHKYTIKIIENIFHNNGYKKLLENLAKDIAGYLFLFANAIKNCSKILKKESSKDITKYMLQEFSG